MEQRGPAPTEFAMDLHFISDPLFVHLLVVVGAALVSILLAKFFIERNPPSGGKRFSN